MARRLGGGKGKNGKKKHGRSKIKAAGKSKPISAFVRGRISAQDYWKQIGQPHKG